MESIETDPPPPQLRQAQIPLPSTTSGVSSSENKADFTLVPIHIVTEPSQLPIEFLEPSPEKQLVVGFDCEGVDLCRNGRLCIMQVNNNPGRGIIGIEEKNRLVSYVSFTTTTAPVIIIIITFSYLQLAFTDAIYLVDVIEGGITVMEACKPALESNYVMKVIHDCKRDSEALYFQFSIKLNNVMDTQIAYSIIEEQEGKKRVTDDYISFVGLLADPRYCGMSYPEKEEVRVLLRQDPSFWAKRPLSDMMIQSATDDVRFLLYIYSKMMDKLTNLSLWRVLLRGVLYCRCFCLSNNSFADWPALPPIPDGLAGEDSVPQEEILSVLDVPPGKMGRVIGRRGASIMSVKQSCNAEIHMGGAKGPPDRVFIIGPVREVRMAEALLRGQMMDM